MDNKKGILGGILSLVAGAASLYLYSRYNQKSSQLKIDNAVTDKTIDFEHQKEKVMNMIEDSRKKFSENHTPPTKNAGKKASIHNQNHNVRESTKRTS